MAKQGAETRDERIAALEERLQQVNSRPDCEVHA
jgi:hypothetical protein